MTYITLTKKHTIKHQQTTTSTKINNPLYNHPTPYHKNHQTQLHTPIPSPQKTRFSTTNRQGVN